MAMLENRIAESSQLQSDTIEIIEDHPSGARAIMQ